MDNQSLAASQGTTEVPLPPSTITSVMFTLDDVSSKPENMQDLQVVGQVAGTVTGVPNSTNASVSLNDGSLMASYSTAGELNITDISQVQILQPDGAVPDMQVTDASQVGIMPSLLLLQTDEKTKEKTPRKGGWPKGKKRKKGIKDVNKPKQPTNGYVKYMNSRREAVKTEHPELSFSEISKVIGNEWSNLDQSIKQKYLNEAEKDRVKYLKDLQIYYDSDVYKKFIQEREMQNSQANSVDQTLLQSIQQTTVPETTEVNQGQKSALTVDIPIFTEEFLAHNKDRETELRQLRTQNIEFEEQNAILSKHIDNMKKAINKLEANTKQLKENNDVLKEHLDTVRQQLVTNFAGVPLPVTNELPTLENVENYMMHLHQAILESPQENQQLIAMVRDVVGKLNLGFENDKL